MDVEFLTDDLQQGLTLLRNVLPNRPDSELTASLLKAGCKVETALNHLLDPSSHLHTGGVLTIEDDLEVPKGTDLDAMWAATLIEVRRGSSWEWASMQSKFIDGTLQVLYQADRTTERVAEHQVKFYTVGTNVEVKYEYDGEWYWAEIQAFHGSHIRVWYPDYDCAEDVSRERIKPQSRVECEARVERVLPDCQPSFLHKILEEEGGDENSTVERVLSGEYPKRESKSACASEASSSSHRDVEYWFDQPRRQTSRENRRGAYATEARQLLFDEFCELRRPGITALCESCDDMYAVVWKLCFEAVNEVLGGRTPQKPLSKLACPRKAQRNVSTLDPKCVRPPRLREEFQCVREWLDKWQENTLRCQLQERYKDECQSRGLLLECECCFGEHLPEQTVQCALGHLFCATCVKQYVETQLSGGGVPRLKCISTDCCQAQLPRSEIARVLPSAVLSSFDQRLEKASIEAAMLRGGLERLEKCPFCDFVMEMDLSPEENKVFVCQAPECGKESCRLCKQENHLPQKCDLERKCQAEHRHTVEESMSAALIRECPFCRTKGVSSRFVKTDGCNKMTCPKCKGWVCYQCTAMIPKNVGYGHFCQHPTEPGEPCTKCKKCSLWSGSDKQLDEQERLRVEHAGLESDKAYRTAHSTEELHDLDVLQKVTVQPVGSRKRKMNAPLHAAQRRRRYV